MNRHRPSCQCPLCLLRQDLSKWSNLAQGSGQPAGIGAVRASGRYLAGTIDAAAGVGTLGQTAPIRLGGIYDTRPWQRKPSRSDDRWYSRVTPVTGAGLTLRVEDRRASDLNQLEPAAIALTSPWRTMAVSVILVSGDSFPADFLDRGAASQSPLYTGANPWPWLRNARWGPDIIPALSTRGVAEVDLQAWSGHGRFVVAWLSAYWLVDDPTRPLDLRWTVSDAPTQSSQWGPVSVSVPILDVTGTAWADEPVDANAVWRQGSYPLSARAHHQLGATNGGAAPVVIHTRWHSCAMPRTTTWTGPADTFTLAIANTEERTPPAGADAAAMMSVWAAREEGGAACGPLILTCTQGGAG